MVCTTWLSIFFLELNLFKGLTENLIAKSLLIRTKLGGIKFFIGDADHHPRL